MVVAEGVLLTCAHVYVYVHVRVFAYVCVSQKAGLVASFKPVSNQRVFLVTANLLEGVQGHVGVGSRYSAEEQDRVHHHGRLSMPVLLLMTK